MTTRYANLPVSNVALGRIAEIFLKRDALFTWTELKSELDERSYQELGEAMLEAGLLRWRRDDHQEKLELTPAGRAVLRHYLPGTALSESAPVQASKLERKGFYDFRDELKVRGVPGDALRERLATALRSREARVDLLDDGDLEFQSPWLAGNVYLLAPISFGVFEFRTTGDRNVTVSYRVSLRRVRVALLLFNMGLLLFLLGVPPPITSGPYWLNVLLSFLVFSATSWFWGYGIGRMVLSVRFYLFVENVCRKACKAGHRIPGATERAPK